MIKFFRHIRKTLISENKMGKYFKYAIGEIILVVIGILIALQINTWNQNNQRRDLEIKHLKELRSDILATLKDAESDMNLHKKNIQSYLIVENFLFKKIPYHDSLAYHFRRCVEDYQLYPKTSALESLKSTGLDIISNDSLRLKITDFFQIQIQDLVDHGRVSQNINNFRGTLWPYMEKHFQLIDQNIKNDGDWYHLDIIKYPPKKWKVINPALLQNDKKLHLVLNRTNRRRQGAVAISTFTIRNGTNIVEIIDKEINRLEK